MMSVHFSKNQLQLDSANIVLQQKELGERGWQRGGRSNARKSCDCCSLSGCLIRKVALAVRTQSVVLKFPFLNLEAIQASVLVCFLGY